MLFQGLSLATMLRIVRRCRRRPLAAALVAVAVIFGSIATSTSSTFAHSTHDLAQEEMRRVAEEQHIGEMEIDWAGATAALEERALEFAKGVE